MKNDILMKAKSIYLSHHKVVDGVSSQKLFQFLSPVVVIKNYFLLFFNLFRFKPFSLKGSPYFFLKIQRTISANILWSIMSTSILLSVNAKVPCVVVFNQFIFAINTVHTREFSKISSRPRGKLDTRRPRMFLGKNMGTL